MTTYQLVATAAMGLESLVADELKKMGYETHIDNGRVYFEGTERDIAKTNLWLRVADRVKIVVGKFPVTTFDQLFEGVKALPWEKYMPVDAEFPVTGKSVKATLYSVPDCQAITKKAIVERLKGHYRRLGFLEETGPKFKVEVSILKDVATLTIDTSGNGLHKRGYRTEQGEAPLKETMAAALVYLSRWTPARPFVDPFCGSGTIALEAAMIGQNIAPGYNREFICEDWPMMKAEMWDEVRGEADAAANYDQPLNIIASDIDQRMVAIAKNNVLEAGFEGIVEVKQMQVADFTTYYTDGVMIGNPPYGERIGEKEEIEKVINTMGTVMRKHPTWSVYMLSSMENFDKIYGKKATKKRKLFNGAMKTDYFQFWGQRSPRKPQEPKA